MTYAFKKIETSFKIHQYGVWLKLNFFPQCCREINELVSVDVAFAIALALESTNNQSFVCLLPIIIACLIVICSFSRSFHYLNDDLKIP